MNVEQRLLRALERVDQVEPSSDLWARVVHSIDEDRAHRSRVIWSGLGAVATALGLVAVGALFVRDGLYGPYVERHAMEALELVGLVVVVVIMCPAMRRFGRNYVADLFPAAPRLASGLLRLVDVAYFLVFAGYILLTTRFEFDLGVAGRPASRDLAEQLHEAAIRLGGLLLLMGVLHAVTLMVLPVVAFVHNSTLRGRALPRWLRNLGVIVLALVLWQTIGLAIALVIGTS